METTPHRKSTFWVWLVVPPVVILTAIAVILGPEFQREAAVRRLENRGCPVNWGPQSKVFSSLIPGLPHFQRKCLSTVVIIGTPEEARELPEIVDDVRSLKIGLLVDLTGSDDIERDLALLPAEFVNKVMIHERQLTVPMARQMTRFTDLLFVEVPRCQFDPGFIKELTGCKSLRWLIADESSMSDEELNSLHTLTDLSEVGLSNTQVSDEAKQKLLKVVPNLELTDD